MNHQKIYKAIFSVVTAVNKEVLTGTNAVTIECRVTGLTAQLQTVKWTKSDGTDVTSGVTHFASSPGFFSTDSQTTTLTVAAAQNDNDKTYKCLITPAAQDDPTEVSTDVKLNVFGKWIDFIKFSRTSPRKFCKCTLHPLGCSSDPASRVVNQIF